MKGSLPKVSVILPTYNRAHLVGRAIESVFKQSYSDLELIVVDDGSTDNTQSDIKKFSDSRFRYVAVSHGGGAAARNAGIQAAKGQFIAFQDSDDEWFPSKLEKQMNLFSESNSEVGAVYCGFYKIGRDGMRKYYPGEEVHKKEGMIYRELLSGNFITTQSAVVRRECLDKVGCFDISLPGMQEWDLWIRVSEYYLFGYVPEALLVTYFTDDSITSNQSGRLKAKEIIFNKYTDAFRQYPKIYSSHAYAIGHALALKGDMSESKHYLLESFKKRPWSMRSLISYILAVTGSKRLYRAVSSIPRRLSRS